MSMWPLFGRRQRDRELEEEIQAHLTMAMRDRVERGDDPRAAELATRREFGNRTLIQETTREMWGWTSLERLCQDARYALRGMRRSPGFTTVAVLSLALGIGANTAIFSLINAVLLKPLPVSRPEQLLQVTSDMPQIFTNPIWEQIRNHQDVFSGVFAYGRWRFSLGTGGETHYAKGSFVSGQYFDTLGVHSALGRTLNSADDQRGCDGAAVLSDAFWRREYGGRRDILGKTIFLDNHPVQIVGVTESRFSGIDVGSSVDVYVPLCSERVIHGESSILDWNAAPGNYNSLVAWLRIIGRPNADITASQVNSRLKMLAPEIYRATVPPHWRTGGQDAYRRHTLAAESVTNGVSYLRRQYRPALLVLMTMVALVLLIACANIANLLLARGAAREREISIRLALGCWRGRLIRQLLTESLLLAGMGTALGVLLAKAGTGLLAAYLDVFLDLAPDVRVLLFTVAVSILTGLLSGLVPAWRGSQLSPHAAMQANSGKLISGSIFGLGKTLVVAQVGLSVLLVVAAGLLLSTFWKLTSLDAGFEPDHVLLMSVDLRNGHYASGQKTTVYREMIERLRAIPGVRSAGASDMTPICGCGLTSEVVIENLGGTSSQDATVNVNWVSDHYFETLGISMVAGRDFNSHDSPMSPQVAVINQAMARSHFAATNPLGRHFRIRKGTRLGDLVEIVAIVRDSKASSLREDIAPTVYLALNQKTAPDAQRQFELRAGNGLPAAMIGAAKSAVQGINDSLSLEFTPLSTQIDESLARERLLALLSSSFGVVALLMMAIGLYGVMSYSVARRRKEIGIRIALGAERARVMRMVLGEVALLIGIGLTIGLSLAVATTRLVASFLYGLAPNDPLTFCLAALVLTGVTAFAGYLPARRASRLEPMAALREE